jgi:hypothetical protein
VSKEQHQNNGINKNKSEGIFCASENDIHLTYYRANESARFFTCSSPVIVKLKWSLGISFKLIHKLSGAKVHFKIDVVQQ